MKKKNAPAAQSNESAQVRAHSTANQPLETERAIYHPLTWRTGNDQPEAPREAFRTDPHLAGLLVLALVAGALLVGVLQ